MKISDCFGLKNRIDNVVNELKDSAVLKWLKAFFIVAFLVAIGFLLYSKGSEIEWKKVYETILATPNSKIALGLLTGLVCYCAYACYDLFGRAMFQMKTPVWASLATGWISYASNMNFGALMGSFALRYRMYSRVGLGPLEVSQVIGVSMATNWMGYACLAGSMLLIGALPVPENWAWGKVPLGIVGGLSLVGAALYLYACYTPAIKKIRLGGRILTIPALRTGILQFVTAFFHWTFMALTVYVFMPDSLDFPVVFSVLLLSALAGAMSQVPGGLGVVEAVFLTVLSGRLEEHEIVASLFTYRVVFFLLPLTVALPGYLLFEWYTRKDS